ncbi:unnamed protein product [Didymodactylos carnosus]|uniref:Uncharacterized protein n=1 Tax=Didymodactylos carnosus TaxID=1234261 RepID=A0A813R0U8_9BILA|nr:unnamed protein product [Didymodactylos carnosus]CAF1098193.1 unnamed protein product [Didymodactylos carnosus]CAF3558433.1 unnamed protein product [Didymodactylos carnosus]CAF3859607.1 unnamed protein product [Didymodactylos carnosus]
MPHYGHHIIDRETGLCEICDRAAIYDIKLGKKPQLLYGDSNGRFVSRSNDNQSRRATPEPDEEEPIVYPTPRHMKRVVYVDKPSPRRAQTRLVHENEPRLVMAQPAIRRYRRAPTPEEYYYVDDTGHIQDHVEPPPRPKPKQYLVQPTPHTRIIRRQRQPSPKIIQRRQHQLSPYSDSELVYDRYKPPPPKHNNSDYTPPKDHNGYHQTPSPHRQQHHSADEAHPEFYHIVRQPRNDDYASPRALQQLTHHSTPSPRYVNGNNNRKLEPLPVINKRPTDDIVQPTIVRRVYKKIPDKQMNGTRNHQQPHQPPNYEQQPPYMQSPYDYNRPVRKVEKLQSIEHQPYQQSPETSRYKKPPMMLANQPKAPSIYYIRGEQ